MESDNVKQRVTTMRNELHKRRESARERFSGISLHPQKPDRRREYTPRANPSRARINEVLAALFHKTPESLAPDETPVNDPV